VRSLLRRLLAHELVTLADTDAADCRAAMCVLRDNMRVLDDEGAVLDAAMAHTVLAVVRPFVVAYRIVVRLFDAAGEHGLDEAELIDTYQVEVAKVP